MMTVTMVIVALLVLFGAALMGKMLMDMYPNSILDLFKRDQPEDAAQAD